MAKDMRGRRLAGKVAIVTGALWLVDGGITPAHGNLGDYAEHTDPPAGVLKLEHAREGLENTPEYPKIEGAAGAG